MSEQCRYCGRQRSSDLPMNRGLRWWECEYVSSCRDILDERVESLQAALELSEGSIRAALSKADDAPLSADAHLSEALKAAELVLGSSGEKYSAGAASLRGIVAKLESLTRERDSLEVKLAEFESDPGGYLAVGMFIRQIKEAEAERDRLRALLGKWLFGQHSAELRRETEEAIKQ